MSKYYPDCLNIREQKVLNTRHGLEDGVTHTLKDIGEELGISIERVRQIETKAFDKILLTLNNDG